MLTGRRSCGPAAAPRADGILAPGKGGRPAATAAAAPPRSRLRREIRGDQRCSLMAGVLLTGWQDGGCPRRALAAATASAVPAAPAPALRPGQGWRVAVFGRVRGPRGLGWGRGGRRAGRAAGRRRRR